MAQPPDENGLLERAIRELREPVVLDEGFDARVMRAVAELPTPVRPGPLRQAGRWLLRPRPVRVRPAVALAAAAAAVAVVGLRGKAGTVPGAGVGSTPLATAARAEHGPAPVQFLLVAPNAASVSLVGDFNDWQASATPMASTVADGLWMVTVPLAPGRYRYAFLVDGATWVPDPDAPRAIDDDFGRPNSVLTIGGS